MIITSILSFIMVIRVNIHLKRSKKTIDEKVSSMDKFIVNQILESDKEMPEKVIESFRKIKLYSTFNNYDAMREARRLHGLDPLRRLIRINTFRM